MAEKDGFVWICMRDGKVIIGTAVSGSVCIGPLDDLRERMKKAGFEEDDRVRLEYTSDELGIRIVLNDPDLTVFQADLCMKSFISCLRDSGVVKNPIVSRIEKRVSMPLHIVK